MSSEHFDPEKIIIRDIRLQASEISAPERFDAAQVRRYDVSNSITLAFSLTEKLIKADFSVKLKTDSFGLNDEEAQASFLFNFIFLIENMPQLVNASQGKVLEVNGLLRSALANISYSTTRGLLLSRLQGSAFEGFILPVISPDKLSG